MDPPEDEKGSRFLIEQLLARDQEEEDAVGYILSMMVMLPFKWLVEAKGEGVAESDVSEATQWVAENFGGVEYAGPVAALAIALWGGDGLATLEERIGKADITFNDMHDFLGVDLAPAMMWLCAGLVATVGKGDHAWIQKLGTST